MNGFAIAVIVLLVIGLVLAVLSVWFPTLKQVLRWVCAILLEIPYFLLFWWWYATLMKALGKKYPPIWPWKIGTNKNTVKSKQSYNPKKTTR